MAYPANPFLERASDRTVSDQEFVALFSPVVLERLDDDAFHSGIRVFHSAPGGGKTTLLRAFTPPILRAFWNHRGVKDSKEAYQGLHAREILGDDGPRILGVLLSCASGYADLPSGVASSQDGLFRALLDCRVILQSLRSLVALVGHPIEQLNLSYSASAEFTSLPPTESARELYEWAEHRERDVYEQFDLLGGSPSHGTPSHQRLESVLWLQSVRFRLQDQDLTPRPLLMVDDLHKLRRRQRSLLLDELTDMRPRIPVWLAERHIALGDDLLHQGAREGRDIRYYSLEESWGSKGAHFASFALNVLDRRLDRQKAIPVTQFAKYLRAELHADEHRRELAKGFDSFATAIERHRTNPRYREWTARAVQLSETRSLESLRELYVTLILLTRDEDKPQTDLGFEPLSERDFEERDSSQVQAAADIFLHEELGIPYYFGIDRLCTMASFNVDELLSLAASLYDGLKAKRILRKELILSPAEQEKLLRSAVAARRDFIPRNHTEGTRAQRILDAIGSFCREKTFEPNAPIAPGVSGVRLSAPQLNLLASAQDSHRSKLRRVLSECVAENLLMTRPIRASSSRLEGTAFYLNRGLCAHYGLPLQLGGWQETTVDTLATWMERGRKPAPQQQLRIG